MVTYEGFVKEIRAYKSALRRALEAESGVPSEDTLACLAAMAEVNPCAPDPAKDADLWVGEYSLLSCGLALDPAAPLAVVANAGTASVANVHRACTNYSWSCSSIFENAAACLGMLRNV